MFDALTAPVGAILGAGRHPGRRAAYHRRGTSPRQATASRQANAGSPSGHPRRGGRRGRRGGWIEGCHRQSADHHRLGAQQTIRALKRPTQSRIAQDTTAGAAAPIRSARLGTVGPLAWPGAYEDVIGFTLWPKEYGERLRVHGIGDVLSTAFAPALRSPPGCDRRGPMSRAKLRRSRRTGRSSAAAST